MKIGIGFNGSISIIDNEGKRHIFDPNEAKQLQTAIYKWVQKKEEGLLLWNGQTITKQENATSENAKHGHTTKTDTENTATNTWKKYKATMNKDTKLMITAITIATIILILIIYWNYIAEPPCNGICTQIN